MPVTRVDGVGELMSMMLGVGQRLVVGGFGYLGRICAGLFSFQFISSKLNKIASN